MPPLKLALLKDFPEEEWPSMDLGAEMLHAELAAMPRDDVDPHLICANFRRRFTRLPLVGNTKAAKNADRLNNRLRVYPRYARKRTGEFDLFHLCDHSYSHLVHALPAGRAGVFCHDLDTFRCVLEPGREPRPGWFRRMVRHILDGFRKAAVVFYTTGPVREAILRHGLAEPGRLVHAPNGVAKEFTPGPPTVPGPPFLLHVGTCIPRKRIDVLLDVFARVRGECGEDIRLVQIGGSWTDGQAEQLRRLGIADAVTQKRGLTRGELAEHYRSARVVLQPSEAEGFGLPVAEALACGAAVVASDIPVLREVGGAVTTYRPVADVAAWSGAVCGALENPGSLPPVRDRLANASRYTWKAQAETVLRAYSELRG